VQVMYDPRLEELRAPFAELTCNLDLTVETCLLTWDRLICLFPYMTFRQHKMYNRNTPDNAIGKKLAIFNENGWHLEDLLVAGNVDEHTYPFIYDPDTEFRFHVSVNSVRRVGDQHAYRMGLDTGGVSDEACHIPSSVLDHCEFFILPRLFGDTLFLGCQSVTHPFLRWLYTAAPVTTPQITRDFIFTRILSRLKVLLPYAIARLPPEQRPYELRSDDHDPFHFQYDDMFVWRLQMWQEPGDWRYMDHIIPEWYNLFVRDKLNTKSQSEFVPGRPGNIRSTNETQQ